MRRGSYAAKAAVVTGMRPGSYAAKAAVVTGMRPGSYAAKAAVVAGMRPGSYAAKAAVVRRRVGALFTFHFSFLVLPMTSVELVPPKPKELERKVSKA